MVSDGWSTGGLSGQRRFRDAPWVLAVAASAVVLLGLNAGYLLSSSRWMEVEHKNKVLQLEREEPPTAVEDGFGRTSDDTLGEVVYYSDEASPGMMGALWSKDVEGTEVAQDRQVVPLEQKGGPTTQVVTLEQKGGPTTVKDGFGGASDETLLEGEVYYSDEASPGMMGALWSKYVEGTGDARDRKDGRPTWQDTSDELLRDAEDVLAKKKINSELHPEVIISKRRQLDNYVEWHRRKGLAPTLDELVNLTSSNDERAQGRVAGGFIRETPKVTVILNVFERKVLAEQLDSLFNQTKASHIAEVWVCAFHSPETDYVLKVVGETERKNVRVIVSDVNFKFYGRFQMALAALSDFVWLLDDDVIPGRHYLQQLMHAAGTELMGRSVLGSVGRVLPRPGRGMHLLSYREWGSHGGMFMPDYYWDQTRAVPVDFLCSQWFLRTEWLQYMWRERPATFETGEDFHISHTLRKYAGISTYVMPYDVADEETKGSKYQGLSYLGGATHKSDVSVRDKLWMDALKAGSRMRWMDMLTADKAHIDPAALLIVRTEEDVRAISPLIPAFQKSLAETDRAAAGEFKASPWKPFIFSPSIGCDRIVEILGLVYHRFCSPASMRIFGPAGHSRTRDGWSAMRDLKEGHPAEYELAVETTIRQVLYTVKARAVIIVHPGRGNETTAAAHTAAAPAVTAEAAAAAAMAAVAAEAVAAGAVGHAGAVISSASLERAVMQATASYNDRVLGDQEPARIINMAARDTFDLLSIFSELSAEMMAAFHEAKTKVIDPAPARRSELNGGS